MKSKKILSLALIMITVLCLTLANATVFTHANAEDTKVIFKITGHKYSRSDILSEVAVSAENHYIEYCYTNHADGSNVLVDELDSKGNKYEYAQMPSDVEFLSIGTYTVRVRENTETGVVDESLTFQIKTQALSDEDSISYELSETALNTYSESVKKAANEANDNAGIKVNDSYKVPELKDIIKSKFFPYSNLNNTIYYSASNSTTYTSTSSTSFKVTTIGNYSFYVLPTDPCGITMSTDDLAVGAKGWYKTDADGKIIENDLNLVIPIFSFNVGKTSMPSIDVETSEEGFKGLTYDLDCFTINATNYDTKYCLFYSETDIDVDSYDKAMSLCESGDLTDLTEDEIFDATNKKFTPDKTGYYFATVRLVDGNNNEITKVSEKIKVLTEFNTVTLENEYVRNNWLSIVFLCISLACFIAIVAIIVVDRVNLAKQKKLTVSKK